MLPLQPSYKANLPVASPSAPTHLTYLEKNKGPQNLERLSHTKYTMTPETSCMTREACKKVPYFKPSTEKIHNGCIGLATSLIIGNISARIFSGSLACIMLKNESLNKNFFPIASECVAQSYSMLGNPSTKITMFFQYSAILLASIGACVAARFFLHDYSEKSRFELLDQEYSQVAQALTDSFKQAQNIEGVEGAKALRQVQTTARQLQANLVIIKDKLMKGARLDEKDVDFLLARLSSSITPILASRTA